MRSSLRSANRCFVLLASLFACACSSEMPPQALKSVDSAVAFARDYRDNPNNEGGNENLIYMPTREDWIRPGYAPTWMHDPSIADECLVLIIAKDRGFRESNWISFFYGLKQPDIVPVKEKVLAATRSKYARLTAHEPVGSVLTYEEFRSKVDSFRAAPLQSARKTDQ